MVQLPANEADLFEIARAIASPPARTAYLQQACGDDTALRDRVLALLRVAENDESFLESPPPAFVPTITDRPITESPGDTIGPYKLLEQIGEGGFGIVFMAEQTAPVKRKVALKVIKPGMDTRQVIARFEAERQALALMDHTNIAKVLDAGATETGRPFFVMELVRGVSITEYCDQNHLTPRERLELFVTVCHAVQHAHQKGIIHRDLKPSNVLVTRHDDKPVVKVIDFGVAKATSGQLTDKTLFTGFAQLVGTPLYMSPEQASMSGLDIDTRSDIYSLGVLLYELLTGTTPFDKTRLQQAAFDEVRRIIREEEPQKPSTRLSSLGDTLPSISAQRKTEPHKLSRLVRGDLDWIVMKSLEKDRAGRYETANGFAADVLRYLSDEVVSACPPSAGYRFRKFARRNKGGLALAALVLFFLLLLGSSVGWAVRDRTEREAEIVQERANREAELKREREARKARVAGQVESVLAEVDRLEGEQKWPEALAAARRAEAALASGEADTPTTDRVRQRLKDLGFIDRLEQIRMQRVTLVEEDFDAAHSDGDYARVFRDYGVDVEELAVESSIDRLKARTALTIPVAAALDEWALIRQYSERAGADSDPLLAVARGIDPEPMRDRLRSISSPLDHEARDELDRLAESIDVRAHHPATLSRLAVRMNDTDSKVRFLRDAQYVYPGDFWLNFWLAATLNRRKDHAGAIRFATAAVSIRPDSAFAHNNLGKQLLDQNELDEAVAAYRKAIELDPKNFFAHFNLGNALIYHQKLNEAVAVWRKTIELSTQSDIAYLNLGASYTNLGNALFGQEKWEEAVDAYRKAIEINPKNDRFYENLGNALNGQQQWGEAIDACRKAIELNPKNAKAYSSLGAALSMQKKLDEAIAAFQKAIELDQRTAFAWGNLGALLAEQGDLDGAIFALREAIELDPKNATAYSNLGIALNSQTKWDEAIAACRKGIEQLGANSQLTASIHFQLGKALENQGNVGETIACFEKAVELDPKNAVFHNALAWVLTNCRDATLRDSKRGLEVGRKAVELAPESAFAWQLMGWAYYRAGVWKDSIEALEKSCALQDDPKGGNAYQWFFLAMVHWKLGEKDQARDWHDRAIEWMDAHEKDNTDLIRFRAEAEVLLELNDKK